MPISRETELELVLLGIVAKFGPCTPYAVRRHFEGSPTHFFSSSTGSIYPAMERLRAARKLARKASLRGNQRRKLYSITDKGRDALKRWLTPPLDDAALGVPHDNLRTRLYFLTELKPKERRALLDHAIESLEARLPEVRAYVDSHDAEKERVSHLAARGCLQLARAQIRWLKEVRDGLAT